MRPSCSFRVLFAALVLLALAACDEPGGGADQVALPVRVPRNDAAKQPTGWSPDIDDGVPDIDDGVKVNILPLQTAGLLRIAKVVSAASEEDE
jgi:hypothetical protein